MTLDEIQEYALGLAKKARSASARVRTVNADIRNKVLFEVANSLRANEKIILEENAKDLAAFKDKISPAKYDRLTLNHERLEGIAVGVEQIASFADPSAWSKSRPSPTRLARFWKSASLKTAWIFPA